MKSNMKYIIVRSGIIRFLSAFSERIVILKYHSIHEDPKSVERLLGKGIVHSTKVFKEQMSLVAQKYTPITLDDIVDFMEGKKKIPPRPVAVTFDDGFADNLVYAAPILERYGIKGAFYITVDNVTKGSLPWFVCLRLSFFETTERKWVFSDNGYSYPLTTVEQRQQAFIKACRMCASLPREQQKDFLAQVKQSLNVLRNKSDNLMLTWEQINKLKERGHIIGSHSMTHPNLAYLDDEDLLYELKESKYVIEKNINKKVLHFSYPNPALDPNWTVKTVEETRKAGYQTGVTSTPGSVSLRDDIHILPRMWVPSDKTEFIWYLERTFSGGVL